MPAIDYRGFEGGDDTVIWRYMAIERIGDLLNGKLYFAAARQFPDDFEGAITQAENARREAFMGHALADASTRAGTLQSLSEAFADLRSMTKVNCWHAAAEENVAMWERYRPREGQAVAVASTVGDLKRSLRAFRLEPSYGVETIRVGAVQYIDYAEGEMADSSMLGVFFHKRREYRDEREIRALLSLRMAAEFGVEIPDDGVMVSVGAQELIGEIRTGPEATQVEIEQVGEAASRAGLRCPVRASTLASRPIY